MNKCTCVLDERGEFPEDAMFHSCPFDEEIFDNSSERCACCPACTHDCMMEI